MYPDSESVSADSSLPERLDISFAGFPRHPVLFWAPLETWQLRSLQLPARVIC